MDQVVSKLLHGQTFEKNIKTSHQIFEAKCFWRIKVSLKSPAGVKGHSTAAVLN